jgi:hypothetical protein
MIIFLKVRKKKGLGLLIEIGIINSVNLITWLKKYQ